MVSDLGQIEKRLERLENRFKEDEDSGARERVRVAQARESSRGIREASARNGDDTGRQETLRDLCS